MRGRRPRDRRFLAPEVVQTSAMDCGPATLKSLLGGFGIHVSYGRLREACQTHLDGTSIDTLEEVAQRLGLDAEQVMVPVDHLLVPAARCLPAIVVVRLPAGDTHFVVAWRRHRGVVQVMDPATGRRWPSVARFLEQVYVHEHRVAAAGWREWAGSDEFLAPLRLRMEALGGDRARVDALIAAASDDPEWRSLAVLDAAVRAVDSMVRAGAVTKGEEAIRAVARLGDAERGGGAVPDAYWSVRPVSGVADEPELGLRGAVVVRAKGLGAPPAGAAGVPELQAAVDEPPAEPARELWRSLRTDGVGVPVAILAALAMAGGGVVVEAVLLRGLFHLGRELAFVGLRVGALAAIVVLAMALCVLEVSSLTALLRLGRRVELRLRMAFLEKVSRLGDRYFGSRPVSDMAERSHSLHRVRAVPELAGGLVRALFEAGFTALGIAWLRPSLVPLAIVAAAVAVGLPLAAQPWLVEQDLRVRTHAGGLVRFYLDALLGLVAVRTHGAEPAVRREHEGLLVEWARASRTLAASIAFFDGVHSMLGFALAATLLLFYVRGGGEPAGVLLLVYWALNLPVLGQEVAAIAWQYPALRNVTLRLLEPLGAIEDGERSGSPMPAEAKDGGVAIRMSDVCVRAAGHEILRDVSLEIAAGSQVAVVGRSGAGKSSLAGLLLGWHRPASGTVQIDGEPLDGTGLERLRRETAWVDPAVQLWNRSLLDNLCYGAWPSPPEHVGDVVDAADLRDVIQRLPDGMQTDLGEGGALVSGGEGQRVRLGRSMLRPRARLVILDEPFRGLDRERRAAMMMRARAWWPGATMLCITHDVSETRGFERVIVIEDGRIAEDGAPADLEARHGTRYRALLDAEATIRGDLWSGSTWRFLRVERGQVIESASRDPLA